MSELTNYFSILFHLIMCLKNNGRKRHSSLSHWKDNLTRLKKWTKTFLLENGKRVECWTWASWNASSLHFDSTRNWIPDPKSPSFWKNLEKTRSVSGLFKRRAIVVSNSIYRIKLDGRVTVARPLNLKVRQACRDKVGLVTDPGVTLIQTLR